MRNLKRALSLALALVMVISMMVVGVSAVSVDDFSDGADVVNKEAVSVLATLNVINGKDDGSYDPTGVVTRAEMAKMICVILNGGKDPVLGETLNNTYTDTANHWAKSYIEYCTTLGIVAGKGDGTFDPNGNVTVAEAGKMVLVALGYNAGVEGYTGANWQINTDVRANALGLYEDLSYTVTSADLTRDNAAQLLYNALDVRMVTYSYVITGTADNAITTKPQLNDRDKGTMLWEMFGAVKVKGVVVANEFANLEGYKEDTDRAPEGVNVGTALDANRTRVIVNNSLEQDLSTEAEWNRIIFEDGPNTFVVSTGENVLGKAVWMYVKPATNSKDSLKATVIGSVFVDESNNVITDASGDKAADVADDNNLEVNADTQYAYNYGGLSSTAPAKDGYTGVQKTIIDTDDDGYVDYVLYREMRLGKVSLKNDAGDGQIVVGVTGNGTTKGNYIADDKADVMGFENVAKDNFVLTAFFGGKLHVQLAETVTGTIEAYKQTEVKDANGAVTGYRNTNFTVDGENYTVSRVDSYTGTELTPAVNEVDKTILSSAATFYLDENGYFIAYGEVDEAAYKYAFVWGAAAGDKVRSDEVKVTLEDGSTKNYYLSSNSDIDVISDTDSSNNANTSTHQTTTSKAKITETDMEGKVFSYTITSSGEIKLYLSKQGTVSNSTEAPSFSKGLTAIKFANSEAKSISLLKPADLTTNVNEGKTYYSNNSTTFFYVVREGNILSNDIKEVNVYNGRNNAPSVDPADSADRLVRTTLALNSKGDVGAAVFDNVKVSESAGLHMFVTANGYVSEDYCLVNAYLNGSTELSTDLRAALYKDGEIVHNPEIKDGLYLYTIDSNGYYELTKPVMGTQTYYFSGIVGRVNTANSTFAITKDGTDTGELVQEFRIADTSIVVDNALNTVVAVAGNSASITPGDEVEVIVNNSDDSEVLMMGILKHGDYGNSVTGPQISWDGKTKPASAVQVFLTGTAADATTIANAFQNGDVFIQGNLPNGLNFSIPTGRTLYVTGDVGTSTTPMNSVTVNGTLMVGDNLYTNMASIGSVGVKGNWYVKGSATVSAGANATVEKDIVIDNGLTLAADGKIYASNIKVVKIANVATGANLIVKSTGHIQTTGEVDLGIGTATVEGANSLVVGTKITAATLKIGTPAIDPITNQPSDPVYTGRVTAANVDVTTIDANNGTMTVSSTVTANTINVEAKATVTVTGAVSDDNGAPATVNVDGGSLTVGGTLTGTLNIDDAAGTPAVNVPSVKGTVNNQATTGTVNAGTAANSEVILSGVIVSGTYTYSGKVTIDQGVIIGSTATDGKADVTLIFNNEVTGLDNLTVAQGSTGTVIFGANATTTTSFAKFTTKDGDPLSSAKQLVGSTFKWDDGLFKMRAPGAYYSDNQDTVTAAADNSRALYG
ncbi:S-layer homology domain-containing protein [Intestinimonas butyriciproducens]|uniref:S-layer homology domain-containing protein n=1 Tax=Intestinimonas butyriciproducens TaxID=1297617 RepID=UPI0019592337|nr:S-layer homology domain-containing protein [Intestinimonas butyriciproducens]MBM6977617.1 S-layer homology domain-containing protein [Intestinimonas butyriciproducens]